MRNFLIYPKDTRTSPSVFRDPSNDMRVRDLYSDLCCDQCGKLDELAALGRGISEDITFPKQMPDFFASHEDLEIVSLHMKNVLDSIANVKVRYFAFPSDPRFLVALPDALIRMDEHSKAVRIERRCTKCKRIAESVFGSELYILPVDFVLGALVLESVINIRPIWVASEEVVKRLKQEQLKGLEFDPYFKVA